jgi:hypothetical protein
MHKRRTIHPFIRFSRCVKERMRNKNCCPVSGLPVLVQI